jgi:putative phage-type endonuclease
VSAIVGVNPYRTAHDVYLDKRGLLPPQPETLGQRVGHTVERLVAELYAEETGAALETSPTLVHPTEPWIVGTPDRIVVGARRIVEIKWVGWRVAHHWTHGEDGVPDYVRTQVEWLMELTDTDECHVAALIGGDDFRIYTVRRNHDLFAALKEAASRFWREQVLAGVPPTVDHTENARRMLTTLHKDRGEMRAAPAGAWQWVERRIDAEARIGAAEKDLGLANNKLREMIGDAAGILDHWGSATWRADKNGKRTLRVKVKEDKAA